MGRNTDTRQRGRKAGVGGRRSPQDFTHDAQQQGPVPSYWLARPCDDDVGFVSFGPTKCLHTESLDKCYPIRTLKAAVPPT